MNKFRVLTIVAILLLLINVGTLVYLLSTKNDHEHPGRPGDGASNFIIEQLQLDKAQQQQFFELRRQHQDIIRQARDEDRRLHDLYFGMLKTDNPDRAKIDSISSLMAVQRERIESATFDHFQQLRKICRDDQKKRFDATIDEIVRRIGPKGPPPPREGPPPRE